MRVRRGLARTSKTVTICRTIARCSSSTRWHSILSTIHPVSVAREEFWREGGLGAQSRSGAMTLYVCIDCALRRLSFLYGLVIRYSRWPSAAEVDLGSGRVAVIPRHGIPLSLIQLLYNRQTVRAGYRPAELSQMERKDETDRGPNRCSLEYRASGLEVRRGRLVEAVCSSKPETYYCDTTAVIWCPRHQSIKTCHLFLYYVCTVIGTLSVHWPPHNP